MERGKILRWCIISLAAVVAFASTGLFISGKSVFADEVPAGIELDTGSNTVRISGLFSYIDSQGNVFKENLWYREPAYASNGQQINIENKNLVIQKSVRRGILGIDWITTPARVTIDGTHNITNLTNNGSRIYHSYTNRYGKPISHYARNDYWALVLKGYIRVPQDGNYDFLIEDRDTDDWAYLQIGDCDWQFGDAAQFTPMYISSLGWTYPPSYSQGPKHFKTPSQCANGLGYPFQVTLSEATGSAMINIESQFNGNSSTRQDMDLSWIVPADLGGQSPENSLRRFGMEYWVSKTDAMPDNTLSNAALIYKTDNISYDQIFGQWGQGQKCARWQTKWHCAEYQYWPVFQYWPGLYASYRYGEYNPISIFEYNRDMAYSELSMEYDATVNNYLFTNNPSSGRHDPWFPGSGALHNNYIAPISDSLPLAQGLALNVSGDAIFRDGASVWTKGRGYPGGQGDDDGGYGPGGGARDWGGSYGGLGNNASNKTYGSLQSPTDIGSGGGNHHNDPSGGWHSHMDGGAGGGKIAITASGSVQLLNNSYVNANGMRPNPINGNDLEHGAGAGSGGTINISAGDGITLEKTNVLDGAEHAGLWAEGGAPRYLWGIGNTGQGGGGGRIALRGFLADYCEDCVASEVPAISVAGGGMGFFETKAPNGDVMANWGYPGKRGTIYLGTSGLSTSKSNGVDNVYRGREYTYNISYTIPSYTKTIQGGSAANPRYLDSSYNGLIGLVLDGGNSDQRRHFVMDGNHLFYDFTMRNGAVLTHSPADTQGKVNLPEYTGTAGLGLSVINKMRMLDGSKIDVSAKGYPGGLGAGQWGYGPGGGGAADAYNDTIGSSGGGFGGQGGSGINDNEGGRYPPGIVYGNEVNPAELNYAPDVYGNSVPTTLGSGGGYARNRKHDGESPGGRGGGAVYIRASEFFMADSQSKIIANGGNGTDGGRATSGGGAGGSISIEAKSIIGTSLSATALGGWDDGMEGSVHLQAYTSADLLPDAMIQAKGGAVNYDRAGGGGGGRIAIHVDPSLDVSLKLVDRLTNLEAVNFDGWSELDTNSYIKDIALSTNGANPTTVTGGPLPVRARVKDTAPLGAGRACNEVSVAVGDPTNPFNIINGSTARDCDNVLDPPLTIKGDVYGHDNVILGNNNINPNSILAGGSVSAFGGHQLPDYTRYELTEELYKRLDGNISQLKNERARSVTTGTYASQRWYLQTDRQAHESPTHAAAITAPEGGIWYVDGDLVLDRVTFYGRGTIIVKGRLTIQDDILTEPDPRITGVSGAVGFIVGGNVFVNSSGESAQTINAAIYAHGSPFDGGSRFSDSSYGNITVAASMPTLQFTGLLAAKDTVLLPSNPGVNSIIQYDGRLATSPPPGFRQLVSFVRNETAP